MPADAFPTNEKVNGEQFARVDVGEQSPRLPPRAPEPASATAPRSLERWLLRKALAASGNPPVAVELWDGTSVAGSNDAVLHRFRIADRRTLWKILLRPEFEFAEGYSHGRVTTESYLVDLTETFFTAFRNRKDHPRLAGLIAWATSRSTSLKAARENIHRHYDLGNDFYRLWLDERMLYTCAYFEREGMSLEDAQTAKMDYVCRKLWLQPGDRVIEAGCGWGALALHMARYYGAQVTAYNISREQIAYAREQAREQGLSDRVTFVEDDWRHISGQCDAFVSVGMLEHVGLKNYRRLGRIIRDCLTPEGRGLIHTIGLNCQRPLDRWTERRIFPGAQPPSLREAMNIFEPFGMSILDVENLRLHYAETLRHWLARFEQSVDVVREMFDETFVRMWRMYLAASVSAFQTSGLQLFQIVFAPETNHQIPRTRAHLYTSQQSSEGQTSPASVKASGPDPSNGPIRRPHGRPVRS